MKEEQPTLRETPEGTMQEVREQLPLGWYAAGGACLLYALLLPLTRPLHILLMLALAAACGALVQKLTPVKTRLIPYERPVEYTGDAAVDEVLRQGEEYLARIDAADRALPDAALTASLARIKKSCGEIFDYIRQNPGKVGQIRRFMNYYLPTLTNLLDTRAQLESTGASGENIDRSKRSINQLTAKTADAFEKFYDELHAEQAMNVNAEISVFENMLRQEGL